MNIAQIEENVSALLADLVSGKCEQMHLSMSCY
jgi:hypothetical protein